MSLSGSLGILSPRPAIPAEPAAKDSTTQLIEDGSLKIVTSREPLHGNNLGYEYLHPAHVSVCDNHGLPAMRDMELRGRDEFIRVRAELKVCNPDVNVEVSNVTSTVDEAHGLATVYLSGRISRFRLAEIKPRETVTILQWKRLPGFGWTCTQSRFVHGFADVPVSLDYARECCLAGEKATNPTWSG